MNTIQLNNVWMIAKSAQKHDFAKGSLCIGFIAESVENFLNSYRFLCFPVQCLPHYAICSFS